MTVNADLATGERRQNWTVEPHRVEISNLRGKEQTVSLDANGFQYLQAPTRVKGFAGDEVIRAQYYPESLELLKAATGAARVVFFDHTIRRNDRHRRGLDPGSQVGTGKSRQYRLRADPCK